MHSLSLKLAVEGSGCLCYIISSGGRQSKGKKTVSILFLSQGQRGRKTLAQKFSPNTSSSMRDFASQSHTYMHRLHIGSNKHRHSISTLTKKAQTHTNTHTLPGPTNIHACQVERSIQGENRGVRVCAQVLPGSV